MSRILSGLAALVLLALLAQPAAAVQPDEILDDPMLEARAREIGRELRCLVCQNQSIDDSNAPLARDLRVIVRERLLAGDSDDEVIAFVVDRYGDYVLLEPPFKTTTVLLWTAPLLALSAGAVLVFVILRRRPGDPVAVVPLTAAEQRRVDALLGGDGKGADS